MKIPNQFKYIFYMAINFALFNTQISATEIVNTMEYDSASLKSKGILNVTLHPSEEDMSIDEAQKMVIRFEGIEVRNNLKMLQAPSYVLDLAGEEINLEKLADLKAIAPFVYSLDLSDTCLNNEGLEIIAHLTNLRELYISDNRFDDEGMKHLAPLKELRKLKIVYNKITSVGLKSLLGLKHLEELDAGCTYLENDGIKILSKIDSIKHLNVRACGIDDQALSDLYKMQSLKSINLSSNKFTEDKLKEFAEKTSYRELKVAANDLLQ